MGHLEIMKKKIEQKVPLLILIRNTHYDLYPPDLRKRMIDAAMRKLKVDAKTLIIDDIESVNWGRGVGYEVNEVDVQTEIKNISATEIRERISKNDNSWKTMIPEGANKVLEDYLKESGLVVWFTGVPKSGKSTISSLVNYKLERMGIKSENVDSKLIRSTFSKDLGFTKEDRLKNLENAKYLTSFLSKNGAYVICSFISPFKDERDKIRKEIEKNSNFVEVYVKASIDICKKRDGEGLYKLAEEGKIQNFTGVSDPYEIPENSEIVLDTEKYTAEECANKVVDYILSFKK